METDDTDLGWKSTERGVIGIFSSCGLSIGGGIESGAGCPADGGVGTEGKGGTESSPQGLSVGQRRVDLKKITNKLKFN